MAWCKMMPRGVGIISTPGQAIFENSLLDLFGEFGFYVFSGMPEYARNGTYRFDLGSGRVGMG